MRKINNDNSIELLVADILFSISAEETITLCPAPRYHAFIADDQNTNEIHKDVVKIRFCHNLPDPDTSPVNIWEVNEPLSSWKVFDYPNESRIFLYDQCNEDPTIISIYPKSPNQTILIKTPKPGNIEVLKYPMDIILMYYLSLDFSLFIVHASGFSLNNYGHICLGRSGAGKSTLFNLAKQSGGTMIQDDRLILRQTEDGWFMYPMPLSENDRPVKEKISRINVLAHGPRNLAIPITGNIRIHQFLPHIVHFPNWNQHHGFQLNLVGDLLRDVRIFHFFFTADLTAIQYLQDGKDSGKYHYIPPEKPMPTTIKSFRQKHDTLHLPR